MFVRPNQNQFGTAVLNHLPDKAVHGLFLELEVVIV